MRWPEKGDQLMKLRRRLSVWCAALVLVLAGAAPSTAADQRTYTNPLMSNFADAFSDPGIIRAKDGYWYAYATTTVMTRENQQNGGPPYYMPIARSADLVARECVGTVLNEDNHPEWNPFPGTAFRAPDVRYLDGTY